MCPITINLCFQTWFNSSLTAISYLELSPAVGDNGATLACVATNPVMAPNRGSKADVITLNVTCKYTNTITTTHNYENRHLILLIFYYETNFNLNGTQQMTLLGAITIDVTASESYINM